MTCHANGRHCQWIEAALSNLGDLRACILAKNSTLLDKNQIAYIRQHHSSIANTNTGTIQKPLNLNMIHENLSTKSFH